MTVDDDVKTWGKKRLREAVRSLSEANANYCRLLQGRDEALDKAWHNVGEYLKVAEECGYHPADGKGWEWLREYVSDLSKRHDALVGHAELWHRQREEENDALHEAQSAIDALVRQTGWTPETSPRDALDQLRTHIEGQRQATSSLGESLGKMFSVAEDYGWVRDGSHPADWLREYVGTLTSERDRFRGQWYDECMRADTLEDRAASFEAECAGLAARLTEVGKDRDEWRSAYETKSAHYEALNKQLILWTDNALGAQRERDHLARELLDAEAGLKDCEADLLLAMKDREEWKAAYNAAKAPDSQALQESEHAPCVDGAYHCEECPRTSCPPNAHYTAPEPPSAAALQKSVDADCAKGVTHCYECLDPACSDNINPLMARARQRYGEIRKSQAALIQATQFHDARQHDAAEARRETDRLLSSLAKRAMHAERALDRLREADMHLEHVTAILEDHAVWLRDHLEQQAADRANFGFAGFQAAPPVDKGDLVVVPTEDVRLRRLEAAVAGLEQWSKDPQATLKVTPAKYDRLCNDLAACRIRIEWLEQELTSLDAMLDNLDIHRRRAADDGHASIESACDDAQDALYEAKAHILRAAGRGEEAPK